MREARKREERIIWDHILKVKWLLHDTPWTGMQGFYAEHVFIKPGFFWSQGGGGIEPSMGRQEACG